MDDNNYKVLLVVLIIVGVISLMAMGFAWMAATTEKKVTVNNDALNLRLDLVAGELNALDAKITELIEKGMKIDNI